MANEIKQATVQEAMAVLSANPNAVLIDVRETDEVKELAPTFGKTYAMSRIQLETFDKDCGLTKTQPIFLLCRSGGRSMRVATALASVGYSNLTNVEGGILAWSAAGLPTKKG